MVEIWWECYFDLKFHHVRCEHQLIVLRDITLQVDWVLNAGLKPLFLNTELNTDNVTSKVESSRGLRYLYLTRMMVPIVWYNVPRSWDVKLCDVTKYTLIFPGLSHCSTHWIKTLPQHRGNGESCGSRWKGNLWGGNEFTFVLHKLFYTKHDLLLTRSSSTSRTESFPVHAREYFV